MLEFDDFPYHKDRVPKEEEQEKEFFKDLEEEFRREIIASPEAKAYLKNFRADGVDFFIQSYAQIKASLARFYNSYNYDYREAEEYEYKFHLYAENALHAILQKKLFNVQLKWRAGQIRFESDLKDLSAPRLDISFEFNYWERNITSCPFIEPISEIEKNMMKEYLLSVDETEIIDDGVWCWQNYDQLTERDEEGDMAAMIDWYEFYDLRTGTGSLLLLPDLKEEKETFYMDLAREERRKNDTPPPPAHAKEIDDRPWLHAYGDYIINFAKAFEKDKYFKQLFKGYETVYRKNTRRLSPFDLEPAIDDFLLADRKITFPGHLNWDEAIMYAFMKYQNTKAAEALDTVYDEYLMRRELGMNAIETSNDISKMYLEIILKEKRDILRGRVINGEPADFNY